MWRLLLYGPHRTATKCVSWSRCPCLPAISGTSLGNQPTPASLLEGFSLGFRATGSGLRLWQQVGCQCNLDPQGSTFCCSARTSSRRRSICFRGHLELLSRVWGSPKDRSMIKRTLHFEDSSTYIRCFQMLDATDWVAVAQVRNPRLETLAADFSHVHVQRRPAMNTRSVQSNGPLFYAKCFATASYATTRS